jgi:hypothetical protein
LFDCSLPSRRKGSRHTNNRNEVYDKMKQPHGIFLPSAGATLFD